jgi:two-component system sensor histidine kinase AlgZ
VPPNSNTDRYHTPRELPDCCNLGVILYVLLVVNGISLIAVLLLSSTWQSGFFVFVEQSVLIETSCFSSLFVLCIARRFLWQWSVGAQRIACIAIPAAVTGLVARFLALGEWPVPTAVSIDVVQTMFTAGLFGFALQHYFSLRNRAFSPALAEARLQALQARIRPHFLFNSLNAALSLIRDSPRQAENTLQDLADLFRVLMQDARDTVSLEDEIVVCKQYLSIEKIRLGDRLQVDWELQNIDPVVLRTASIPSLLLQPLLENAVHYGVEPSVNPGIITVHLKRSMSLIEIVVRNSLPASELVGENETSSNMEFPSLRIGGGNHMALGNIRERLALLYDVEAGLVISRDKTSFEARLHFPYRKRTA